ncbi:kinase-like domain-containing protein [Rhizophagus irregularis DAOM 181602=DAOM 197198]|uniref:Ypk1p n=1 Tax=Rhizophagus irregularis (strain DAOM 197198w) TaxID=1432141 RepID=A0A015IAR0_RHIIW|nr:Ypk1p [Rhizophagus irregularis DAOM 197198w]GBC40262.1 kinase-like domain-containing protein [Rhizophagus irregularis DAOM 181602=DAOM 197198]
MSWNGYCEKCEVNTRSYWCKACNAKRFQQNFKNWTSGNNDIDKFIQDTQLSANDDFEVLEWIPYNKFYDIEYIAKGGFGKVYRAKWIDGQIERWDNENQNWRRLDSNMFVALKSLNNSENVTLEFINELMGITQDPETKNYMMVLEYAENGSLRNCLNKNYSELDWKDKLEHLSNIASGLKEIHKNELTHRDLHIGNILTSDGYVIITDIGLCKPADYKESESAKNKIYGVLPYIAPEILRGQNYTKASDIYSFGIIMYEVISGLPPYHDASHDINLSIKICQGLRPRFNIKVPQLIVHLIKRCLDANPLNRPTTKEIADILDKWGKEILLSETELQKQIKEAEEINHSLSTSSIPSTNLGLTYETHSEAVYTSRLLNFNNLPEPKNSDDYYEKNDNIISEKFSEFLQINISHLKISDADETKSAEEMIE